MIVKVTYSQALENLGSLLDKVTADRQIVIVHRNGREDVALIAASELSGLLETAHLLRSPANAKRLLDALGRAFKREGSPLTPDDQ